MLDHVLPSSCVSRSESESQLREEGKAEDLNLLCAFLPGCALGCVPSACAEASSPSAWPHGHLADISPSPTFGEHEDYGRENNFKEKGTIIILPSRDGDESERDRRVSHL